MAIIISVEIDVNVSIYKYKNNLKDEVGMAGTKSTQTRFVGIIISTVHPLACFSRFLCTY